MKVVQTPATGDNWVGLTSDPLPVDAALRWSVRDDCGAQVLFTGTVRDHADGRDGVTSLDYEAYTEQVTPKLDEIIREARARWPVLGRIVLLHRVGVVELGEVAVVVVVSSPHRPEAFAAARFCIDTLKASVPIWKKETWEGGVAWGADARPVEAVARADAGDPLPQEARQ